jgi:hypothetical protein
MSKLVKGLGKHHSEIWIRSREFAGQSKVAAGILKDLSKYCTEVISQVWTLLQRPLEINRATIACSGVHLLIVESVDLATSSGCLY